MQHRLLTFFRIDLRSLAVFRMALGLLLIADLLVRFGDLTAFYTDAGVVPRDILVRQSPNAPWLSLHVWGGSWLWQATLFAVSALLATSLFVGYRTRWSVFLSWLLLVSLQSRNPLVLNGGDVLLRTLLMWSNFLPLGRRWSLDCRHQRADGEKTFLSPASAAVMLHVCLMYWMTGYFKYDGWGDTPNVFFQVIDFHSYAKALVYRLVQHPDMVSWLGYGVLALEIIGPAFLFIPFWTRQIRMVVVLAFFLLHLGIELSLTVGMFTYVSWCAWLLFVPDLFWDSITQRGPGRSCPEAKELLLQAGGPVEEALVLDSSSRSVSCRWGRSRTAAVLASLVFGYALAWNISTSRSDWNRWFRESTPMWLNDLLLVRQRWNMFALPAVRDGWFVMVARLRDGTVVDLLRNGAVADWGSFNKPSLIYLRYPNHRWRKFYRNVAIGRADAFLPNLCRFEARGWEMRHGSSQAVDKIELYFMQQMSRDPADRDLFMQRIVHEESFARETREVEPREGEVAARVECLAGQTIGP